MITTAIIGLCCLSAGLYAGKRRAIGDGWGKIAKDACTDSASAARTIWDKASYPFRKGEPSPEKPE